MYLILIKFLTNQQVINKVTTDLDWVENYTQIFNQLSLAQQNNNTYTINHESKVMTIENSIEITKKGWIYDYTTQKKTVICTLHLIEINNDYTCAFNSINIPTQTQLETQTTSCQTDLPTFQFTHQQPFPSQLIDELKDRLLKSKFGLVEKYKML